MSTDHAAELVNTLKDIKETLAAQTEHLKTNSLLLQALLELNQKEAEKRTGAEQRVNNEATKPPDVKVEAHQDSGQREQPRNKSRALYAEAPPNFTLTWELTEVDGENQDKEWYHIDDHKLTTPRPLPCPPEKMHLSGDLYVPYSHSRTRRSIESREMEVNAEMTGLGSHADTIVNALNNLYSVPADARLPLCFEPLSLRRMKIIGELDEYLIKATQFLEDLRQASGTFIIWDYDILGNHFCYYPSDLSWINRGERFDRLPWSVRYWRLVTKHELDDRYYKLIPMNIYRDYFRLQTSREHWQATDWAACSQKYLRVRAHLSSQGYLGFSEPQTVRPWYRIIDANGLECIDGADVARTFVHFLTSKLSPALEFYFTDSGTTSVGHLLIAVQQHLKADPLWGAAITTKGQWETFHISWYRASPEPYKSSWGYGPLYVEEGSFLSRQSFSVTIYCSNYDAPSSDDCGPYWTMLVLPPPHFYTLPEVKGEPFWNSSVCLRSGPLDFIDRALNQAATDWAGLDPYFDQLDAKRELIFDPGKHDSLLFDDRHFTQSRLYFWAINSLGRFIQDIDFTIERWETFWREHEDYFRRAEKYLVTVNKKAKAKDCGTGPGIGDKNVDQLRAFILSRIQSLKNTRQSFESRRQKIIEYRDGPFNASSVIETREATRLSQNVKLLTFVSIFYLPLGFCMSMWSINENYNANNLVAVTICIGLATYIVVANLETTVYSIRCGLSLLVEAPRQRLVRKMMEERGTRWSFLGRELSRVQPSREDAKPSEWLVVGYWLMTIYRSFKSFRGTKQPLSELDAEQNSNAARETPTPRNPINLLKRLRPRSKKDVEQGNPPTKDTTTTSLAAKDTTPASEPLEAPLLLF